MTKKTANKLKKTKKIERQLKTKIMGELTEWDIEQLNRFAEGNKNAGQIVETKTGLIGRTYNHENPVNGKIRVYTDKGKLLCDPNTLKLKGFID